MNFLKTTSILFAAFLITACAAQKTLNEYPYGHLYKDLPFEMPKIKAPVFPDNEGQFGGYGKVCLMVLP